MSNINFSIPKTLEKQVAQVVKQKGFNNKAEFFRFAAINFINIVNKLEVDEEERFNYLTKALSQEVVKKYRGKKIPLLKKQLAGI